jgi:hypothetical protein
MRRGDPFRSRVFRRNGWPRPDHHRWGLSGKHVIRRLGFVRLTLETPFHLFKIISGGPAKVYTFA